MAPFGIVLAVLRERGEPHHACLLLHGKVPDAQPFEISFRPVEPDADDPARQRTHSGTMRERTAHVSGVRPQQSHWNPLLRASVATGPGL
eukprot:9051001-Pyramimonas_sp.AAC.1